jgi:hypothetical protein
VGGFHSINDYTIDVLNDYELNSKIVGFEGSKLESLKEDIQEKYLLEIESMERRNAIISIPEIGISIVPFNYHYRKEQIISNLIKVISNNEEIIKSRSIGIPLMQLTSATANRLNSFGQNTDNEEILFEIETKAEWCCFGHLYLHCLKQALKRKEYSSPPINLDNKFGNIINVDFEKSNGYSIRIHADAGL